MGQKAARGGFRREEQSAWEGVDRLPALAGRSPAMYLLAPQGQTLLRGAFTCEMEPPRIKDGFSEATAVLDDGMRGGGGRVGRVVGSRTPSGRLAIT